MVSVDVSNFEREVIGENVRPVFVLYMSSFCIPCRQFGTVYAKAAQKYPEMKWCSCNRDQADGRAVHEDQEIEGTPTVLVYYQGLCVGEVVGFQNLATFEKNTIIPVSEKWKELTAKESGGSQE